MSTEKVFEPNPIGSFIRKDPNVPKKAKSDAFEKSLVISTTSGRLHRVSAYNKNAATRWLMLFEQSSLPANATVPDFPPVPVITKSIVHFDFGESGVPFDNGLVAALSSTEDTLTIITDNDAFFVSTYRN